MSERSAALGAKGPPKTIEHNGKTYTIAPVLTQGTMLAVEQKLYERAKVALLESRDLYTPADYALRADALRARREEGHYAFESPSTMKFLQTDTGVLVLLSCMVPSADAGELLELLTHKPTELEAVMNEIMEDSFPGDKLPKRKAPAPNLARRNRGDKS